MMGLLMYRHQFSQSTRRARRYPHRLTPQLPYDSIEDAVQALEDRVLEMREAILEYTDTDLDFQVSAEGKPS